MTAGGLQRPGSLLGFSATLGDNAGVGILLGDEVGGGKSEMPGVSTTFLVVLPGISEWTSVWACKAS